VKIQTIPDAIKYLWTEGFFRKERNLDDVRKRIEELGLYPSSQNLHISLKHAKYLGCRGQPRNYRYRQKKPSKSLTLNEDILSESLIKSLGKEFETEIKDLRLNFGESGTCTAFILRKILEKLIFLTFAKNNLSKQLEDNNGDFVGLKTMLNLATVNKVQGKPFLMPKTAKEIAGIKFLGDTSAHNPLINVEMKAIILNMPYIVTAFGELSKKL